jgi:hypothetical protein
MSHRAPTFVALLGLHVFCFWIALGTAQAQDAQAAATAKAAKQGAAADATRSNLEITTPTNLAAPPRTSTTAPADAETLKQRAGEQAGDMTRGRTLILGMKVKEGEHGGVQVADVGAATPAFEAGIRKGDEIISFQNFKADSYRKWIDGMRRLATGVPDGSMLTVVVMRDGSPVTTKVRVPESQVGPVQLPLGLQPGQQSPQPNGNTVNAVGANGGDSNINIENTGAMASFFNDGQEASSERAVAELFRVGPGHKVSDSGRSREDNQSTNAATPPLRGARVGFAGFRNDANGMLVMVDVGGLEPGNYTVSISDASVIGNQAQPTQSPASNLQGAPNGPAGEAGSNGLVPNSNTAPPQSPNPLSPPQSKLDPPGEEFPRAVLAQVSANAATDSAGGAPPTGQVQPLTAPATGQVNPTNSVPTGRSNGAVAQGAKLNENPNSGATAAPMQNELGTLTVDQSGTGRMQHVVEGVRVRNVVGQALVIYTSTTSPAVTLPPNLDPTADPGPKPKSPASANYSGSANPTGSAGASPTTGAVPVVAGVIRLLSDRGSASTGAAEQPAGRPAGVRQTGQAPNVQPTPLR